MNLDPTATWLLILALALVTAAIKAAGPLLLGGRELPRVVSRVIALLPAPLLAALVVTTLLADGRDFAVDASVVGVGVAGVMLWFRRPILLCVLVAVAVTAGLRALG